MEYIQHTQCKNDTDVKKYYYRSGLLLSVLYALEAEDIHSENMIANGSHPVIVDLETLFHHNDDTCLFSEGQEISVGKHTVLKTHFLPQFINPGTRNDVSAIANNTFKGKTTTSVPHLNGKPILINRYVNDFIKGFADGYKKIFNKKKGITSKNSQLNIFKGTLGRYVPRSTNIYNKLIIASQVFEFSGYENVNSTLRSKLSIDLKSRPFLIPLIETEEDAILQGEVPRFYCRVDQTKLFGGDGKKFDNYFSVSGLEISMNKIQSFSKTDLEGQIKLIELSLGKYTAPFSIPNFTPINNFSNWEDFYLQNAKIVADLITKQELSHAQTSLYPCAVTDINDDTWIDLENRTFFDGSIGICLFLAHLYEVSPNKKKRVDLKLRLRKILESEVNGWRSQYGGIEGVGGILYALSTLNKLWPECYWLEENANKCIKVIERQVNQTPSLDVISGLSGNLISLICCYESFKKDSSLTAADKVAIKIQEMLSIDEGAASKHINKYGIAHGIEGVYFALNRYKQIEGKANKIKINVPSSLILHDTSGVSGLAAWCNGQVGVELANNHINENVFTSQSLLPETLLLSTEVKEYGLCHGFFGNLEYMFSLMQNDDSKGNISKQTDKYLQELSISGISYQANKKLPILGLMNGWAGIGYQLLRFAFPQKIPCLLTFSIPQ